MGADDLVEDRPAERRPAALDDLLGRHRPTVPLPCREDAGEGERSASSVPVDVVDPRTTSVIAGSRLDLLDALERLEAHRPELVTPLVLRDVCQFDYDEIAVQAGTPVGTVTSRIHHARAHVRRSLSSL